MHRRASRWFATEGHAEDAIHHVLAANDMSGAVDILAQERPALMNSARWMELAHLLHLFSRSQIESEPELLVGKAWFAHSQNNVILLQASLQTALAEVARQGEPIGNIRLFADYSSQIDSLLAQLQQTGVAPLFVATARAAIADETPVAAAVPPTAAPVAHVGKDDLAVLLTFREQEVLHLLGERLTNQEIAAKLRISTETVKRHGVSIFRKRDVKNRRAVGPLCAPARARLP